MEGVIDDGEKHAICEYKALKKQRVAKNEERMHKLGITQTIQEFCVASTNT